MDAAAGSESLVDEALKTTLAASATWQLWAATSPGPDDRIYLHRVPTGMITDLPLMLVIDGEDDESGGESAGASGTFLAAGTRTVWVLGAEDTGATREENERAIKNKAGAIMDEAYEASRAGGGAYLLLNERPQRLRNVQFPHAADSGDRGYISVAYRVRYGLSAGGGA